MIKVPRADPPLARRRRDLHSVDRREGSSDEWCSPPEIAGPLDDFFGGPVDTDPCSNDRSIIRARQKFLRHGLILPWTAPDGLPGTVYENDPYSQAGVWTAKMLAEVATGNVTEIIRLSMMSASTWWWSDMCTKPEINPRVLGLRRLSFLDPYHAKAGMKRMTCRFEPALTYIGPRAELFTKTFAHLTRWATWGR